MKNETNLENVKIEITWNFSEVKMVQYDGDKIVNSRILSNEEITEYMALFAIYLTDLRECENIKIDCANIKKYVEVKVGRYDEVNIINFDNQEKKNDR